MLTTEFFALKNHYPHAVIVKHSRFSRLYWISCLFFSAGLLSFQIYYLQFSKGSSLAPLEFLKQYSAEIIASRHIFPAWPLLFPATIMFLALSAMITGREIWINRAPGDLTVRKKFLFFNFKTSFAFADLTRWVLISKRGAEPKFQLWVEKHPSGKVFIAESHKKEKIKAALQPLQEIIRLPLIQK